MSTHPQQTAIRLPADLVTRLDSQRGIATRAAFARHIMELGLASFERNPEQAVVRPSNFDRLGARSPLGSPSPPFTGGVPKSGTAKAKR